MIRKSRFLTAFFSLMPGAGHMYLGLLNKGVSIMLAFCMGIYILNLNFIGVLGLFIILPIFFYSFFDALELCYKINMGMNVEDNYSIFDLFSISRRFLPKDDDEYYEYKRNIDKRTCNIIGIILILIGVFGVINIISYSLSWFSYVINTIKQYIIPLGFIVLGVLILRKK